jgi:hypothetical protein
MQYYMSDHACVRWVERFGGGVTELGAAFDRSEEVSFAKLTARAHCRLELGTEYREDLRTGAMFVVRDGNFATDRVVVTVLDGRPPTGRRKGCRT